MSWKEVDTKKVLDIDGFETDYTWYTNGEEHVFIFGDKDLYDAESGADWRIEIEEGNEEQAYEEAEEWFEDYCGFEGCEADFQDDEDDEILEESDLTQADIDLWREVNATRDQKKKDELVGSWRGAGYYKVVMVSYTGRWVEDDQTRFDTEKDFLGYIDRHKDELVSISFVRPVENQDGQDNTQDTKKKQVVSAGSLHLGNDRESSEDQIARELAAVLVDKMFETDGTEEPLSYYTDWAEDTVLEDIFFDENESGLLPTEYYNFIVDQRAIYAVTHKDSFFGGDKEYEYSFADKVSEYVKDIVKKEQSK